MFDNIQISNRSQALINSYIAVCSNQSKIQADESLISYDSLVSWLGHSSTHKSKKDIEFALASLQAELLADLHLYLSARKIRQTEQPKKASVSAKIKFALFVVSGTLFAACEGFDSATTMLGVLSLSAWIVIAAGLVFAVLSVVVFYGLNLMQVSEQLGIHMRDAPKLIDVYIKQLKEIKSIRKEINNSILSGLDRNALQHLHTTLNMLKLRLHTLGDSGQQFELALKSKRMQIAKFLFSGTAGLMCFGVGFFAAQSVAVLILGLFSLAITPAFWPIMLFSFIVGAAAFNLYWYNDRDSLKKLISSWLGLDEDKIESLSDQDKLTKEVDKIDVLMRKIQSEAKLTEGLSSTIERAHQTDITLKKEKPTIKPSLCAFFSSFPEKSEPLPATASPTSRGQGLRVPH